MWIRPNLRGLELKQSSEDITCGGGESVTEKIDEKERQGGVRDGGIKDAIVL